MITKKQSEITRSEWIAYEWSDITTFSSEEREFVRCHLRNPNDAIRAGENYDVWRSAYEELTNANHSEG